MPTAVSRQTQVASSTLLSTFALWRGTMLVFAAKQPKKRIRLYDLEGDLACRQVRERLTELELAYTLHNVGKEQLTDLGPASLRLRPGPSPAAGARSCCSVGGGCNCLISKTRIPGWRCSSPATSSTTSRPRTRCSGDGDTVLTRAVAP